MSADSGRASNAGAFYLMFIGAMLALIGGVFVWLLLASYGQAKETREWATVECVIIESGIEERMAKNISREFKWRVGYKYQFEGKDYIGDKLGLRGQRWSNSRDRAQGLMEEYPVGSRQVCFVNPEAPEEAILEHDTKAAGYTVWFPGLFVLGGAGMMIGAIRSIAKK